MRNYRGLPSGTISRARELRRNETDAERKLRRGLRQAFPHLKFRRQVPYGPYFADLLCFAEKLIIEVDGGQHVSAQDYDARRTQYLQRQGYRVIRFWNNDVMENLDGVLAAIAEHLSPSPSHAASPRGPLPLPGGEGE